MNGWQRRGVAMEIYLCSSCTLCRKAEQVLQASGKDYLRRDFFKERFTVPELRGLLVRAGLSVTEALSTRSRAYTALNLAERNLSEGELLALMVEEPTLLCRPLVLGHGAIVVGFNARGIQAVIEHS
jgi:Spx/MgsR family transcriptional regulator